MIMMTNRHDGSPVSRLLDDHHPLHPCCLARSLNHRYEADDYDDDVDDDDDDDDDLQININIYRHQLRLLEMFKQIRP